MNVCICENKSVKDDEPSNLITEQVYLSLHRGEAGYALSARGHSMCVVSPFL